MGTTGSDHGLPQRLGAIRPSNLGIYNKINISATFSSGNTSTANVINSNTIELEMEKKNEK